MESVIKDAPNSLSADDEPDDTEADASSRALSSKVPSIELEILRAGALIVAITGFLWQLESINRSIPFSEFSKHWFPAASVSALFISNIILLVSFFVKSRSFMRFALRVPFALMIVFLALSSTYDDLAHNAQGNALWFAPFAGLAAAALAFTVPMRVSLPAVAVSPGLVAIFNSMLLDHTYWLDMLADVGFNIINTFPYVVFAGASRGVAKLVDETVAETRKVEQQAARSRIRAEEMSRFTAFVHDYVLAALSAIANGMKVNFSVEDNSDSFYFDGESVSATRFTSDVKSRLYKLAPDCVVSEEIKSGAKGIVIPGEVANTVMLAISEVARNSVYHAGKEVTRSSRISLSSGKMTITFSDNGVGFDPDAVDPNSAGIRLSIIGRMESLRGGKATVDSTPGKGTTVTLEWAGNTSPKLETATDLVQRPNPTLYELMGMGIVYSWQFCATSLVVIALVALSTGQIFTAGGRVTFALSAFILFVLTIGKHDRLPLRRSVVIMALIAALAVVGLSQDIPETSVWAYYWHLSVTSFLAALFAIRGRPWFALIAIFFGTVGLDIVSMLQIVPNNTIVGFDLLSRSVMVAAGVLSSVLMHSLIKRVPDSIDRYNKAMLDAGTAREYEHSRKNNYQWLERQVGPVFESARALDHPTKRLQHRARLTEQRLRDVLRSPRLNRGPLHEAVWDARERGITVRLLDDRNHNQADDRDVRRFELVDEAKLIDKLLPDFLTAIDNATTGTVTIRLLPPGRRAFASISDENGVQRFNIHGERIPQPS